ncbi:uncharacterized protein rp1l1a [Pagrus major]|uniref:uncharacterized protein rp1l1a n=1 Tax=Pagrus major TaxID=143350 RepID=UPI003CC86775
METVLAEMWDPRPPSKHASPHPQPPPFYSRLAHVTTATPAKRITFYKSGDSQFGGVRMAVHKRSFKCFDALLDDLSQKVPLPFGVRTVTTPRGTHAIKHLEQLQDGGCYLCSDRRQAKPVNMEIAGKRQNMWFQHSHKPHRPETLSATPPGHIPYRQRRILLVKNSEPGMRRSVVLSRRSARSLRAFLDEVSEVMQFHVRKLYTAEGRRIDSVQSLMTCPGVLVCVGREAFSPMLVHFIRKSSEEKLPCLGTKSPSLGPRTPGNGARSPATQGGRSPPHGAQSRASQYSEGHESKKNVNFGLETKKSIIHPRSDSSNRSARFSLSSEKSYSNGVSAYSQARPGISNEDIEKRVLVNKDGSLSVEMRVRFRLQNDESLQWSTQIKKSPSLTNECCPLSQAPPHYLQQAQSESCSDPDSTSFDPEGVEALQQVSDGSHCPCCYHRQEQQYDLWENPAHSHKHHPVPPQHTSRQTHTVMRHTHSSSSSSSGNSRRVVRCRARLSNCGGGSGSEQSQLVQEEMCVTEQVERRVKVEQDGDTHVKVCRVSRCCSRSEVVAMDSNLRPLSRKSVEDELMVEEGGERPLSTVSSSSHVLQSLKEDQDDDLPPSASQCSHRNEPSPSQTSEIHQDDKPASNMSACSGHSTEHTNQKDWEEKGSRVVSAASSCHCGAATPHSTAGAEEMDRAASSKMSRASCRSSKAKIPTSEEEGAADDEDEEIKRVVSGLSGRTGLSGGSSASSVCHNCGGCKRGERSPSAMSAKSHKSTCSGTGEVPGEEAEGENAVERALSSLSAKSGASSKPNASVKLGIKDATPTDDTAVEEDDTDKRAPSALSVKSNVSVKSSKSKRPDSAMSAKSAKSAKSNVSAKSGTSQKSTCSHCVKAVSPDANVADEPVVEATGQEEVMEVEERAVSAMSAKSHLSAKSNKSNKSSKASERSLSPRSEPGGDQEKRATSQMSSRSVKSNVSAKSSKSCNETAASPSLRVAEEKENEENEERAASAASSKSHKSDCNENAEASSETGDNRGEGDANSGVTSPATEPTKTEVEDRTPSAMSGKSHMSAKSSKSQKSNRTTASPSPNEADGPSVETNEEEQQNLERGASALSVKSKSSHKSNSSKKSGPPNPNVVTINITEGADEEGNDTTERAPSAASAKSGKSHVSSASSHKSNCNGAADVDEEVAEDNAPSTKSSKHSHGQTLSPRRSPQTQSPKAPATPPSTPQSLGQQLLPGPAAGDTRGPSALSVHSIKSSKSGKSKCCCGAASAKKEKEEEEKREDNEEASERATSILSTSTKRTRRESGGTEQPLSRNSSGSVSLGLPEDQETADSDSGKSSVSFHVNAERKSQVKTPDVPKSNLEGRGSAMSQKSNNNGSKSTLSHNLPAVDIPTIETPGEEVGEQKTVRAASAISSRSSRSHKSCRNCGVKPGAQMLDIKPKEQHASTSPTKAGIDLETGSVKSASTTKASDKTSSAGANVRSKSNASIKSANVTKTTAGDSGNNDSENQAVSRPASEAKEKLHSTDNKAKSSPCLLPSSRPCSKVETCSDSTLSHSLSAADLLKEVLAAARPHSRHSKASKNSNKPRSEKSRRSRHQLDQEELRLTPACLPNASPNEVVSDWLRSIPADSSMLALGDELHEEEEEKAVEEKSGEEAAKEEESPENEKVEDEEEKVEAEEEKTEEAEGDGTGPCPMLRDESLPRNWHSSAAVMKVLLSSSTGRCQSMPEVSPVYGRRLSTSARGFLDCLAQLELIDPGCNQQKDRNQRYEEIMSILQSLWLTEPRDFDAKEAKEVGKDQVTPPRSSSGVDMSSGSGGSGKENGNQGGDETEQNKANEAGSLQEDEAVVKVGEEEEKAEAEQQEAKTDLAEEQVQSEEQSTLPPSLDSPKATENPSSSDKSSANDSSKSPTDNERETPEDSSSGTPPTVLRAPLSKKLSQDPDPVWILHLLKKLEKQFMSHYVDAMAEFKVRWDLDDSLILNTMMSELREEVSRRIQSSIEREMRKIQSRAGRLGRSPRPPKGRNLSRDSTMTEKRRQMLRVMKNQSLKTADSLSDGETIGDFSDQRSEDEYCPCDACVRKKLAARPFKTNPLAAEAPVMMEFDLLKILQLKKSPVPAVAPPTPVEEEADTLFEDKEVRNLEVLEEEEEEDETKEDIRAAIVLEETIPEEDEEDMEGEKEESSVGDEEQNEGETGGEEAREEETSENGEEEEEEAHCQCQCDEEKEGESPEDEGETEGNEGETGTGEEEEESDKETVREVTAEEPSGETEDDDAAKDTANEESTPVEELAEGNVSASAEAEDEDEEDDGTGEGESNEDAQGGESEQQEREASEEETASPQGVTEGEEADAEDSDTDCKRPSDTSADESGRGVTENKEEKESGVEEEAVEDAVEEEDEEEVNKNKKEDCALLHQFTRTSVESQPGSLEDIDTESHHNPVNSIEVPKMAADDVSTGGGAGQRRSRSPGRVKRRKPKECDVELDDI